MAQFNSMQKEITFKIIYYGPSESGKTTNLTMIEQKLPELVRGRLSSIVVSSKENLSIDFLPMEVSIWDEVKTRFNVFSIPGSSAYHNIRKLFLQEVDGIVFVADSTKTQENIQALQELIKNLQEANIQTGQLAIIMQWNKRDLPDAIDVKNLRQEINVLNAQEFVATAPKNQGIIETLERLVTMIVQNTIKNRTNSIKPFLPDKDLSKLEQMNVVLRSERVKTSIAPQHPLLDRMNQTRSRILSLEAAASALSVPSERDFSMEESSWDSPSGRVIIIKMIGKISTNNCSTIKAKVLDHYMHGRFRLILDFNKIEHIHSSGFGMLIELGNRAQILGGGLALVGLHEKFKVVFELMGMGKAISLCQTEEQALVFFSSLKRENDKYEPSNLKRSSRIIQTQLSTTQKPQPTSFTSVKRNIYISYDPEDLNLAKSLEKSLEQKGYGIFRDEKRLKNEILWNLEFSQSLASSDILLVLWSQSSQGNALVQRECEVARGLNKSVVFWLLKPSLVLPLGLQEVFVIDASSEEQGLQQLFEKKILEQKNNYNYNIIPAFSYMPLAYRNLLVGREMQLLDIYEKLLFCKNVILTHEEGLVPIEGLGKSSLAIEFAYRFGLGFNDGVLYLCQNGTNDWHYELQRLAYQIGLTNIPPDMRLCNDAIEKLRDYIQKRPDLLLIVDYLQNAQELTQEVAYNFIPMGLGCYILATSRTPQSVAGVTTVQIHGLGAEAGLQFMTNFRMPSNSNELEAAKKLCELVNNMPLAITMIAKYLAQNPHENFSKYLNEMLAATSNQSSQFFLKDLTRNFSSRYMAGMNFVIKKLWDNFSNDNVKNVLEIMALLPQGFLISKDILAIWTGFSSDIKGKEASLQDLLDTLQSSGFIEKIDEERVRLPTSVYNFLTQNMPREQQQNRRKNITERMSQFLQDFSRIEREYYRHGLQYLQDILNRALQWNDGNEDIKVLQQAIYRETSSLRYRMILPYSFIQQLYSRIFAENEAESPVLKRLETSLTRVNWIPNTVWLKRVNKFTYLETTLTQFPVICAMFTNDGNFMFASDSKELVLWNTQLNKKSLLMESGLSNSQAIVFGPQKNQTIVAHGCRIRLWDIDKPDLNKWLTTQKDWIYSISFAQGLLASAGKEQKIYIRNLEREEETVSPKLHEAPIIKVCFNSEASKIISIGQDHRIVVSEVPTFRQLYQIKNESHLPTALSVGTEKQIFAVGYQNGQAEIYQLQDGQNIHTLTQHCDKITCIAFSPDGQYMLTTSQDRAISLWYWLTGKILQKFIAPCSLIHAQFSPDSSHIWGCDEQGTVYKFKIMKIV